MEEKVFDADVADKAGEYIVLLGKRIFEDTLNLTLRPQNEQFKIISVVDMDLLFLYLKPPNIAQCVKFNLSLARGLDYYTRLI
jgi:histidyl-tRNA synthetase